MAKKNMGTGPKMGGVPSSVGKKTIARLSAPVAGSPGPKGKGNNCDMMGSMNCNMKGMPC